MSRRSLILEEMGIAPVWRLRESEPRVAEAPADRVLSDRSSLLPAGEGLGTRAIPGSLAIPVTSGERRAVVGIEGANSDDRRAQILRMDWTALTGAVSQCTACVLHQKRTNTVFGVGDEQADWLFVGEGPGAEEDAKGEPFVGQAGRLLDNMLAAIAMRRGENVYIANVVKCRPPGNRNPEPGEMHCCEPYLTRQIMLLKPALIIAMGRIAASHLLATTASIASLRGRVHDFHGTPLIVTYHPAYLLRNLADKAKAWVDLCFACDTMAAIRAKSGG